MAQGDVCLAYLHPHEVGANFHHSLMATLLHDVMGPARIGMTLPQLCSSSGHAAGRNNVARTVLDKVPDAEWLWFIDADMGWQPDTLDRLLEVADPNDRPVVGGLCFAWIESAEDDLCGYVQRAVPTIYDFVDTGGDRGLRFQSVTDYPRDQVVQCAATGAAMLLIHRSALEAVHDEYGPHWFDRIATDDGHMGEDVSFCARLNAVGIPVHVDTSVRTNHLKHHYVSEGHHRAIPYSS